MRHLVLSLALIVLALPLPAFEIEDHARFGPGDAAQELRIVSTADIVFFAPMIDAFLDTRPDTAVDYTVASSAEVMRAITEGTGRFDLAISSAMDLQTKLANDGFARRHASAQTQDLPVWATWNGMVFAFTQEPASIVMSHEALAGGPVPRSRHDLINLLRQHPDRFRGRVGTYDVRRSGLGYLFATQDTRASETYWRLTEILGALGARLYCCSSDMIDAVKSGELLIAYNVLGSYAINREDRDAFQIILPSDFTTVMLRSALIPANAPSPELAGLFIDHVLARSFGPGAIPLIDPQLDLRQVEAALNRIRLGPGLMVYLDQLKKAAFLSEWEAAILQQ